MMKMCKKELDRTNTIHLAEHNDRRLLVDQADIE